MMVTNTGGVMETGQSGYILKEKSTGCGDVKYERKGVVKSLGSDCGKMQLPFTKLGKAQEKFSGMKMMQSKALDTVGLRCLLNTQGSSGLYEAVISRQSKAAPSFRSALITKFLG